MSHLSNSHRFFNIDIPPPPRRHHPILASNPNLDYLHLQGIIIVIVFRPPSLSLCQAHDRRRDQTPMHARGIGPYIKRRVHIKFHVIFRNKCSCIISPLQSDHLTSIPVKTVISELANPCSKLASIRVGLLGWWLKLD